LQTSRQFLRTAAEKRLVHDFFVKKKRLEYELFWLSTDNDFPCTPSPLVLPRVLDMESWSVSVSEERRQRLLSGEDDLLDPLQIGDLLKKRSAEEERQALTPQVQQRLVVRSEVQLEPEVQLETEELQLKVEEPEVQLRPGVRSEVPLELEEEDEEEEGESESEDEDDPTEPEMTVEVLASYTDNSFRELKTSLETQSQLMAEQVAKATRTERDVWRCLALLKRQREDLNELLELGRGQLDMSKDWKSQHKSSNPPERKRRDTGDPGEGTSKLYPETMAFCVNYDNYKDDSD
jgi:hypothetical protein